MGPESGLGWWGVGAGFAYRVKVLQRRKRAAERGLGESSDAVVADVILEKPKLAQVAAEWQHLAGREGRGEAHCARGQKNSVYPSFLSNILCASEIN